MTDIRSLVRAFAGTRRARELHRYYRRNATSIKAGLDVIGRRWPSLRSQSQAEPVFIFAAGWRSGSTFLQRIVLSSNDIFIWGEPYRHAAVITSLSRQIRAFTERWPWDEFFIDSFEAGDFHRQWVANLYPVMEHFLAAHLAYFTRFFEVPAGEFDKTRWGVKSVTLEIDHARYLRWLFPRARCIFLIRNPYHAYASYRKWARWYRSWPDEPVFTATAFGRLWSELTQDYLRNYGDVDGLLLKYESLREPATLEALEAHLQCGLVRPNQLTRLDGYQGEPPVLRSWLPRVEYALLRKQVEPQASKLGYTAEGAGR